MNVQRRALRMLVSTTLLGVGLFSPSAVSAAPPDSELTDETAIAHAEEVSAAFKSVAALARPSVVRILGFTPQGATVTGSGFAIHADGYLLTNNHVVEPAMNLLAQFSDGRTVPATLVGADPLTDLAVVQVTGVEVEPLQFAQASELDVGDWVVAVGFPLGLDQTVTQGIVSATNRRLNIVGSSVNRRGYEDFIQTDAAINRGNSGGPLLNLRGEVVGVNSAIVTESGGSDGLGFAIPTNLANYVVDQIIDHGRVVRAMLGVELQDLTPSLARSYGLPPTQPGVLLTNVSDEHPAGQAGLRTEDVVVAINGQPVSDTEDLRNRIAMMTPGQRVTVSAVREGRPRDIDVVLTEMDAAASRAVQRGQGQGRRFESIREDWGRLAFRLADLDLRSLREEDREYLADGEGPVVTVEALLPGQPAQLNGFEEGDLIVALDGQPLQTVRVGLARRQYSAAAWLEQRVADASAGEILRFTLKRPFLYRGRITGLETKFIAVEMP